MSAPSPREERRSGGACRSCHAGIVDAIDSAHGEAANTKLSHADGEWVG